jgi:hypothetical protein
MAGSPMQPFNPYAPPQDASSSQNAEFQGFNVWQQGGRAAAFVTGSMLPARCVVCNRHGRHKFTKTFYWHAPWLYLLILGGWVVYAIVAMMVRKSASLEIWLCDEHRKRRTAGLVIAWTGAFVGFFGMLFAAGSSVPWVALVFLAMLIALPVLGGTMARVVSVSRIDEAEVHFKAGDAFIASLPATPQQGAINVGYGSFGPPPGPMGAGPYSPPDPYGPPGGYGPR